MVAREQRDERVRKGKEKMGAREQRAGKKD